MLLIAGCIILFVTTHWTPVLFDSGLFDNLDKAVITYKIQMEVFYFCQKYQFISKVHFKTILKINITFTLQINF